MNNLNEDALIRLTITVRKNEYIQNLKEYLKHMHNAYAMNSCS